MKIPSHVTNFLVFKDGRKLLGAADITLPNIQNMNDTLKGSGIAGEIEMPVQGHFQSMTAMFKWNTVEEDGLIATIQDGSQLDCWASQQSHDSSTNKIINVGWRYVMGVLPKRFNFGKLEVGTKGEAESEYELTSLRVYRDDKVMLEIDKTNFICRVWDGFQLVDTLAQIRQQIGL